MDGIIQRAFEEYYQLINYDASMANEPSDFYSYAINHLSKLEQELIEKIKQYLTSSDASTIGRIQTLKQLIGDI